MNMFVNDFILNAFAQTTELLICEKIILTSIGYSTIETKEVDRIGYNWFLFPHEYSSEGRGA